MKYSIRHLLALVLLFAVAIQAGRAYSIRQHVTRLERSHESALRRLRKVEEQAAPHRQKQERNHQQQQLCKQVVFDYEYPADYEAAVRRHARLNSSKPQGP
jgi:hypothetical protein